MKLSLFVRLLATFFLVSQISLFSACFDTVDQVIEHSPTTAAMTSGSGASGSATSGSEQSSASHASQTTDGATSGTASPSQSTIPTSTAGGGDISADLILPGLGNSSGNLINRGLAAYANEWLYYCDTGLKKLYAANMQTRKREIVIAMSWHNILI